jgi:hypothetical protein
MGRLDRLTLRRRGADRVPGFGESPSEGHTGMGWLVCGATVAGAAHVRSATANQDAFCCRSTPHSRVAAVADGHGAPEYVRSDTGARFAADLLADCLATVEAAADAQATSAVLGDAVTRFIDRWRAAVRADLTSNPLEPADETKAAAGRQVAEGAALAAYGTTALGLWITAQWCGAVAIGDGDIGCADAGGNVRQLCPHPDAIGVETDSLASEGAAQAVRTEVIPSRELTAAWICTDGFSAAQVDPDWRALVGQQLTTMVNAGRAGEIADRLPDWLAPAAAVGDDTTMALVVRTARAAGIGTPAAARSKDRSGAKQHASKSDTGVRR